MVKTRHREELFGGKKDGERCMKYGYNIEQIEIIDRLFIKRSRDIFEKIGKKEQGL